MGAPTAPATTREEFVRQLENSALNDLERKLRLVVRTRRAEGWDATATAALQRHILGVAADGLADADRFRPGLPPVAERLVLVRWPR